MGDVGVVILFDLQPPSQLAGDFEHVVWSMS
jgi:hypothetical protein